MNYETQGVRIVIDCLRDCDWKCPGCFVERSMKKEFDAHDKIISLYEECKARGTVEPYSLTIGPTDVFASTNKIAFFGNPKTRKMCGYVPDLAMTTTLLGEDGRYDELLEILDDYTNKLVLVVPLNHRQMRNSKYVEVLLKRGEYIRKRTRRAVYFDPIFNITDNKEFMDLDVDYCIKFLDRLQPNADVEFAFGFTRQTGVNNRLVAEHLQAFARFIDSNHRQGIMFPQFSEATLKRDWKNIYLSLLWREGEWHWLSMMYADFLINYAETTKIQFNNLDDLQNIFLQKVNSQYSLQQECNECEFFKNCSWSLIPAFMDVLGEKNCIIPREPYVDFVRYHKSASAIGLYAKSGEPFWD
ncbi:MAG: hypothetical protein P4M08_10360 [Oligoflexia bacterium]|nr:hypothetical protein [Oligoflexia bacterium]